LFFKKRLKKKFEKKKKIAMLCLVQGCYASVQGCYASVQGCYASVQGCYASVQGCNASVRARVSV
jgi:hypothetical protein